MRTGIGFDFHRLVEKRALVLGGVSIPWEKGLLGHSDADALLHAVCDAILGAAGLGDIGITLPDEASGGRGLFVFFPGAPGETRRFLPYRLPEHETVYAMTVHKSQGSEFDEVLLVLPDRDLPVLTRELIYTALTRARNTVTIWARRSILAAAITRRIERTSGLRDALWGQG